MRKIKRFGISIEGNLLEEFDSLIKKRKYPTRSKAIEDLIREELGREKIRKGKSGMGVIILVYNHHKREISDKLIDIQHHQSSNIVSSQHIHLNKDDCMEIITVKGKSKELKNLMFKLKSVKGVKYGDLIVVGVD